MVTKERKITVRIGITVDKCVVNTIHSVSLSSSKTSGDGIRKEPNVKIWKHVVVLRLGITYMCVELYGQIVLPVCRHLFYARNILVPVFAEVPDEHVTRVSVKVIDVYGNI